MQIVFTAGLNRHDLQSEIPEETLKQLLPVELFAWHFYKDKWTAVYCKCDQGDPLADRFLNAMQTFGIKPRPQFARPKGYFQLMLLRQYDKTDWDASEFFQPDPIGHVGLIFERSSVGRLKLKKGHLRLRNFLGKADWPWLVVSSDMREKMERAGLQRLVFRETEAGGKTLKDEANQIFELDSGLELPPMSTKCDFRYNDGSQFTGDYSRGSNLYEGFYEPPEFHYTRSAIESVGNFDLARTHERFGLIDAPRKLVCSRRFYEFCVAHKVKMNWIPVRIDPD